MLLGVIVPGNKSPLDIRMIEVEEKDITFQPQLGMFLYTAGYKERIKAFTVNVSFKKAPS